MTFRRSLVEARLQEIARVVAELDKHRDVDAPRLARDLSLRWIVERGLLAGSGLVFDVANHLLASELATYPESYEASLVELESHGVISAELYSRMRGLDHVRNLLAHDYLKVDLELLVRHLHEALGFFPAFCGEIAAWMASRGE